MFRRVGIVLAVLVGLSALVWFVWLPQYRPALKDGERYGIDVSHHQGEIDWRTVAANDISFAYIKATEGGDFTDDRFRANWRGAAAAGLPRGAYHFFTLCTPGEAQARHFLRTVPNDPKALPPAVDLEIAGNCAARPAVAVVRRELREFLHLIESTSNRRALLYVGDDFEELYPVRNHSAGCSGIDDSSFAQTSRDGPFGRSRDGRMWPGLTATSIST